MTNSENPYASPSIVETTLQPVQAVETEAEPIRRRLIATEESMLSMGSLMYLVGVLCGLVTLICLAAAIYSMSWHPTWWKMLVSAGLWGTASAAFLALGRGLRQLRSWAGWLIAIASCLAMVALLVEVLARGDAMALIAAPILACPILLVCGKKGRAVMSQEYAEIRRQTPHIQYRGRP